MTAEKPDMDAIYSSLHRQGEVKTELAKSQVKSHIEMMSLLTEGQKLEE